MPWRMMLALLLTTAAIDPAMAQSAGGSGQDSSDLIWNLVGLLGLVGLIGLLPQHEEDSYHPSSFDE